jgi:FixJ family two-component response regulator
VRFRLSVIIDDHSFMREVRLDLLCEAGFVVRAFASAEEFLDLGRVHHCSCPTADIRTCPLGPA